MSESRLGFGIVGTGMIADFHARALARVAGAHLVGIAGRHVDKARVFAEKHGVAFATNDLASLLARPDIAVICITTPSGAHLEPALAAIRAGKHVIIEKPIEITTARADAILEAGKKAGVRVAAIFQNRFGEGARTVKAAINSGRLGRLGLASAYLKWHRPTSYYTGWKGTLALDGGAVVINQAVHGLDLLQWFAGLPEEVFAWSTRRVHTGIEGEDTACASLKYPDGALGTIEATTAAWPGWSRRIELCGESGSVCLEEDRIVRWDFAKPAEHDDEIRNRLNSNGLGSGSASPSDISIEGHVRQYEDFCAAVRQNRPLAVDGREARKAIAFVNALYASAASGQPVKL